MAQELILAVIVSFDTFLASVAYRAGKIRIPILSAVVICFLSSLFLAVSLIFSDFLSRIIPIGVCEIAGFIILTSIGIITMLKSFFRALVRRLSQRGELSLRPKSSGIVIKLYLDDTAADFDCSKTLSAQEAAALALAGSLDSVATGLSCGYNEINPAISAVFAFIAGFAAIILGGLAGKRAAGTNHDFSWLGGAALIAFAVYEFIR